MKNGTRKIQNLSVDVIDIDLQKMQVAETFACDIERKLSILRRKACLIKLV
jgi:hypothetical protein